MDWGLLRAESQAGIAPFFRAGTVSQVLMESPARVDSTRWLAMESLVALGQAAQVVMDQGDNANSMVLSVGQFDLRNGATHRETPCTSCESAAGLVMDGDLTKPPAGGSKSPAPGGNPVPGGEGKPAPGGGANPAPGGGPAGPQKGPKRKKDPHEPGPGWANGEEPPPDGGFKLPTTDGSLTWAPYVPFGRQPIDNARCCVKTFVMPSEKHANPPSSTHPEHPADASVAAPSNGTYVSYSFKVTATFVRQSEDPECDCGCCEYHQYLMATSFTVKAGGRSADIDKKRNALGPHEDCVCTHDEEVMAINPATGKLEKATKTSTSPCNPQKPPPNTSAINCAGTKGGPDDPKHPGPYKDDGCTLDYTDSPWRGPIPIPSDITWTQEFMGIIWDKCFQVVRSVRKMKILFSEHIDSSRVASDVKFE